MTKALLSPAAHSYAALGFIDRLGDEKDDPENGLKVSDEPVYLFASTITPWTFDEYNGIEDPVNSPEYHNTIKREMLFAKHITKKNAHLSIRRYNWKKNTVYSQWKYAENSLYSENWLSKDQPCYVFVESIKAVFLCISNNGGAKSIIAPKDKTFNTFTTLEDGYIWKYMYDLTDELYEEWANELFIPIPHNESEMTVKHKEILEEYNNIQYDSNSKNILEILILDKGEGYHHTYTHTTKVKITGDGVGAIAELVWDPVYVIEANGSRYATGDFTPRIVLKSPGKGYTFAKVEVECDEVDNNGNSVIKKPMQCAAIINPILYLGRNVINDLNAHHVSIKASFLGREDDTDKEEDIYDTKGGNFPASSPYRRIGLIKNVLLKDGTPLLDKKSRYYDIVKVDNCTDSIGILHIVEGIQTLTTATVWHTESINANVTMLYLIDRSGPFSVYKNDIAKSEYISIKDSNVTARLCDIIESNMDRTSGEFMYIENIKPIYRNNTQKETFLFTIEL